MARRVVEVKKALVSGAGHDKAYGRGSTAIAAATRVGMPGKELDYWCRVLAVPAARRAVIRLKLGMVPGVKANTYKWGGQLARFAPCDAARLMACPCGFGDGTAPQDPFHVAFECCYARPAWVGAVEAMDSCVAAAPAAERAVWASYSFEQKCKWGLSATNSPFPEKRAASMHQCVGAAVARLMGAAAKMYAGVPSLASLSLPYSCPPVPRVLQGMPVLMTRPPRAAVPDQDAVRVVVWPVVQRLATL